MRARLEQAVAAGRLHVHAAGSARLDFGTRGVGGLRLGAYYDRSVIAELGPGGYNLAIDTTTPAGRLIFTIIGAFAAMERELLARCSEARREPAEVRSAAVR